MIFNIFLFLFATSLLLIIVGFIVDIPLFNIVGSVLLIGMGALVLSNDVQIVTGENITETSVYGNYFDDYHWDGYNTTAPPQTDKEAYLFHTETEKTNIYENYDWGGIGNTSYGVLFLLFGIGMFIISLTTMGDD